MPRRARNDYAGAVHHVMNRGIDHQPVFFADADRVDFGRQLAAIHEGFDVETLAYCLMSNHFHLLVRSLSGRLAAAMHHLGIAYTRHVNDRLGRDGPLFRGRYRALNVETDEYLLWAARYIHLNPLAIAGIDSPEQYRWSSYRTYVGQRRVPEFVEVDTVLGVAGGREALVELTQGTQTRPQAWSARDIRQLVSFVVLEDDLRHEGSPRVAQLDRTIALLVSDRLTPSSLGAEVRALLNYSSRQRERDALARARTRAADPTVARLVDQVLAVVGQHLPTG